MVNPDDLNQSARNLAIMLDYIGAKSVSDITFVVDESFDEMKSEHEMELAQLLRELDKLVGKMDKEKRRPEIWQSVRGFLGQFIE